MWKKKSEQASVMRRNDHQNENGGSEEEEEESSGGDVKQRNRRERGNGGVIIESWRRYIYQRNRSAAKYNGVEDFLGVRMAAESGVLLCLRNGAPRY